MSVRFLRGLGRNEDLMATNLTKSESSHIIVRSPINTVPAGPQFHPE